MVQFGVAMVMQNAHDQLPDKESFERDLKIAQLIEPYGFDRISAVEHHFSGYAMSPDNIVLLSWLAPQTKTLKLLTGAVILPWWHNPVRIVERMILLDHLSKGRALFGMGRGLAKREYVAFGIEMDTARERFNESAAMCLKGLETGFVEGNGTYYKQPRVEVRPRPYASFKDRSFCVAMSKDSVPVAAELGSRMMVFSQKPWEEMVDHFTTYRTLFQKFHGVAAPTPTVTEFMFCDENADRAAEMSAKYMGTYFDIIMDFYDFKGAHFETTKGYSGYAADAEKMRNTDHEVAKKNFVLHNNSGTPNQILEKYEKRRKLIGDFDMHVNVSYGGLSFKDAEQSMRTYATKVIPEVRSWSSQNS